MLRDFALLSCVCWLAYAAELPQSPLPVAISAPSVVPGATAQIRLTLATPHQIAAGNVVFNFDSAVFGPPVAVDAFSATGDQNGQATVTGNQVVASFSSTSGGIGTLPGMPAFIVTLPVLAGAASGATTTISLGFGNKPWADAAGNLYNSTAQPVQFEVGGTFSIDSVTPGGGLLPAGTTVRIAGRGFRPTSTVEMDGVPLGATTFVSPGELDITLGARFDITGKRVVVGNGGGAETDFYPSLRGTIVEDPSGQGPLFIFPQQTYVSGPGDVFALQNPTLEPVDVSLTLTTNGEVTPFSTSQVPITLPPGSIFDGWIAPVPGLDLYTAATSTTPIRMFGGRGTSSLSVTWSVGIPTCDAPTFANENPTTACWLWLAGSPAPAMTLIATLDSAVPFTASVTTQGGQWLNVSSDRGTTCSVLAGTANCPSGQITLTAAASIPVGDYAASVTVTPDDPSFRPVTVPFTFRVAKSLVSLVDPPHYLYFTAQASDPPPPPVPLNVTATQDGTPFSVSVTETWLLVSPATGVTPATIGVTVDPSMVTEQNSGSAFVVVTGPANGVSEIVGIDVYPPPAAPTINAQPGSLTFWAQAGGSAPASQSIETGYIPDATVTVETK